MSICKYKNSPYYYTRFSILGIRIQESTRTTSKREAQEYEEKRRKDVRGQLLLGKKPQRSWAEAASRWLDEMSHKRSIRDDVYILSWLSNHLDYLTLKDITKDVIENIAKAKEKEGVKPRTVNSVLCLIRSVLNKAHKEWEWLDRVPLIKTRHLDNARIRWITKEEANCLIRELPPHLADMAAFTLATGLRASNVMGLEWMDVDLVNRHLVVHPDQSKNKKPLSVPLNEDVIKILRRQLGKHNKFVFVYKGNPVSQCNTKAWRKALRRAGIENFRWHDLRHTWASWHVQSGTTLQELYELGGWSSFEMVLRYAHLSSNHLMKAAERISGVKMVERNLKIVKNVV